MIRLAWICLGAMVLASCQNTPRERGRVDDVQSAEDLQERDVVDVAVIRPFVVSPDQSILATRARSTAREVLIDQKRYSCPADGFVDTAAGSHPAASDVSGLASATDCDAVLTFQVDQWEADALLAKGRVYAGGTARMVAADGTTLWERRFSDWALLAPVNVTASNRVEVTDKLMDGLVRDVLDRLPAKPRR